MKRAIWICLLTLGAVVGIRLSTIRAGADSPKVDIPFGTLLPGSTCTAATHMLLSPCPPFPPTAFVVFPDGKNVTRYEGRNVTLRGTVDPTACSLPLVQATRVALSDIVPPCPPQ